MVVDVIISKVQNGTWIANERQEAVGFQYPQGGRLDDVLMLAKDHARSHGTADFIFNGVHFTVTQGSNLALIWNGYFTTEKGTLLGPSEVTLESPPTLGEFSNGWPFAQQQYAREILAQLNSY